MIIDTRSVSIMWMGHFFREHSLVAQVDFEFLCFFMCKTNECFPLSSGHVGAPLPCNLIKLVDVPEKNYFASKQEGEVSQRRSSMKLSLFPSLVYNVSTSVPPGLRQGSKCLQGLPQGPGADGGDAGCRRLASHRRHRQMVAGKQQQQLRLLLLVV